MRRSNWHQAVTLNSSYTFGSNRIDLQTHQAETAAGKLQLTELEMKMLTLFFDKEGSIIVRGELLQSVWDLDPDTETRTLDNFIVRLRKYFESDPSKPRHFLTIRGRGYRFLKQPEQD